MQCVTARSSFSALKLFANGQNIRVCRFSGLTYRPNVLKNNIFDSHWKSLNITCKSLNQRSYCNTPEKVVNSQDCIQNKREQNSVQDIDVNAITNGDPVLEKKLKVLFLEVEVRRQEGGRIPPSIEEKQWKVLLELPSFSGRRKYLEFLWKMEMKKLNDRRKKEENRILFEKVIEERKIREEEHILYALNHNTIFLRFYDTFINNCSHVRLMQAMLYGQKLVFDCGYEEYMTRRESDNCSKQLMLAFSENRDHVEPFDLHFCNVNRDSNTFIKLHKHIPTLYNPEFPLNITEKSYLELFPKKELIYLTPNAREEMRVFDHNAVYIIGALVDKGAEQPLSLAKAKRENLRIAKLPIDRYLSWGDGGKKSLTLNQMVMILLEVKKNGDWHKALEHVPKRKLHREKIQEDHLRTSSVMFTKEFRGKTFGEMRELNR